jgi:hypothetical protein
MNIVVIAKGAVYWSVDATPNYFLPHMQYQSVFQQSLESVSGTTLLERPSYIPFHITTAIDSYTPQVLRVRSSHCKGRNIRNSNRSF